MILIYLISLYSFRIQSDADGGNPRIVWDGIEVRILSLLAARNNFSIEIVEPHDLNFG